MEHEITQLDEAIIEVTGSMLSRHCGGQRRTYGIKQQRKSHGAMRDVGHSGWTGPLLVNATNHENQTRQIRTALQGDKTRALRRFLKRVP